MGLFREERTCRVCLIIMHQTLKVSDQYNEEVRLCLLIKWRTRHDTPRTSGRWTIYNILYRRKNGGNCCNGGLVAFMGINFGDDNFIIKKNFRTLVSSDSLDGVYFLLSVSQPRGGGGVTIPAVQTPHQLTLQRLSEESVWAPGLGLVRPRPPWLLLPRGLCKRPRSPVTELRPVRVDQKELGCVRGYRCGTRRQSFVIWGWSHAKGRVSVSCQCHWFRGVKFKIVWHVGVGIRRCGVLVNNRHFCMMYECELKGI